MASVPGISGASPGGTPLPASLDEAQVMIRELQARVRSLEAQVLAVPSVRRETSELEDGTKLKGITTDEMVAMRKIFDTVDSDASGTITAEEVRELHARLGEPLQEGEDAQAIEAMGGTDGQVDFPAFMKFWHETKAGLRYAASRGSEDAKAKWRAQYQRRFQFVQAKATPELAQISVESEGVPGSLDYRVYFTSTAGGSKHRISPWHDVPLKNDDGTYNMIVEIPKWSRAKYEITTTEPLNPIKQDVKNGKPRSYVYGDMPFNYGAFPQTWEDPEIVTEATGAIGDSDPIDVVNLSTRCSVGSIVRVKILGIVALIDSGETDWKVLTVSATDPLAPELNSLDDLEKLNPGAVENFVYWLKMYKSTRDPPIINKIAFEEKAQGRDYAISVVEETHEAWKKLIALKGGKAVLGDGGGAAGGGGGSS